MLSLFDQDYANQIQKSTNLMVYTTIGMLGLLLLQGVILSCLYIKNFKLYIMEISSIFILISYKSII